jgi:trypsin-like peptidase
MSPDDARKAATGPLGREFGKFPLQFAKPLLFGEYPSRQRPSRINNGTASLLRLDCGPVAVTCHHVIDYYRERLKSGERCLFQIAGCRFDPLDQLISESSAVDLAVLRLTQEQADKVLTWGSLPSQFYTPVSWPPPSPLEGDDVLFSGYPGKWRTTQDYDSVQFASYTGGHRVTAVGTRSFISEVDQEHSAKTIYLGGLNDLTEFGGMSGGPVFVLRKLNLEFVGIVREYSPDREAFHFTHAGLIDSDGNITA